MFSPGPCSTHRPSHCADTNMLRKIRQLARFKTTCTTIETTTTPKPVVCFWNPALLPIIYHSRGGLNKSCVSRRDGMAGRQKWIPTARTCSQSRKLGTKLYPKWCSTVTFWNKVEALRHFSLVLTPSGHSQDNYNVFCAYKRTRRFCNHSPSLCFSL